MEQEDPGCRWSVSVCSVERPAGAGVPARLGVPLVDDYLEFVAARCRPNTVLAAAYDLRGVLRGRGQGAGGGRAARRAGVHDRPAHWQPRSAGAAAAQLGRRDRVGVSTGRLRRRLSSVSGLFAYLPARGDVRRTRCRVGCRLAVSGSVRARASRWCGGPDAAADPDPAEVDALRRGAAHPPGPGDGRGDGAGRAAPLRGPRSAAGGSAARRAAGVHRRGQGRPSAAGPGLGAVLRPRRRLPRCRTAPGCGVTTRCSWC